MLQVDMAATIRQGFGKGAMRSLRQQGQTPAVLYGPKTEPLSLSLATKEFSKALLFLHGQNAVITLGVEGDKSAKKRYVMLKEVQTDPVRDTVVHADFYEISLQEPLTLSVPLKFSGTPKGVDMGGVLHTPITSILLRGMPLDIPDSIEIDVTALELNGPGITCKKLAIPENVTLLEDEDRLCAEVVHPSRAAVEEEEGVEEVEEEAAGAEAVEAETAEEA
jgi:large subunit ribosomal protein L25